MLKGSRAVVRNGKETNFWTSRWVDGGNQLMNFSLRDLSEVNIEEQVADFGDGIGGWDLPKLRAWLSEEGVEAVTGMAPPNESRGEDVWAWGGEKDGRFSIRMTYNLISTHSNSSQDECWKIIWKWHGPNRIWHLLWLAGQDRLLANDQRTRMNIATTDPSCPLCPGMIENTIHVLRDCLLAKDVWNRVG
ncbi:Putative ribonuclease H protein At1g65750 [Linum perenne]